MRIGIALGGGGARGWAHLGVLGVLDRAGFSPEIVAGTSMGAIVGGAYASGRLDALESFARGMNRKSVWSLVDFNRRGGGGLVSGERIAAALTQVVGERLIPALEKKFTAVATELTTGYEIWLTEGDLVTAMRASYALPGILLPVRIDGRILIDGGITNPVPVSACRAMGAHIVIAVPLPATQGPGNRIRTRKPRDPSRWKRAVQALREPDRFVANQMFGEDANALTTASVSVGALNILLDRMTRIRLASDPPDVTITPDIADIAMLEFERAEEAMALGAAAAERALPEIETLMSRRIVHP